jgi:outer membrane protein, multidrug efflux system
MGPNYERPPVTAPDQYYAAQQESEARSLADLPWWEVFDDPVLKSLIEEALKNGFDAQIAAYRIQEARALYGIAKSQFAPEVNYTGGWTRGQDNQVVNPEGATQTVWSVNVNFNWEIDLWGRIRRLSEAAKAEYLATEEARRGVLLSLTSDVATAYFQLRELDAELEIAHRTTEAFQQTVDLFQRRLEGGAASGLEVSRAEASLGTVAAQIPELERAIVATENHLNFLLGRNPQEIPRDTPPPPLPPPVPAGLPSQLLERRPDIREAEQQLVSANALIGEAKAEFFPTLSLTGLFGNASEELSDLFSKGKTWSLGASFVGPLFNGMRNKRRLEAAKARWEQSRVFYEGTVTNAFGEVSTALVDRTKLVDTVEERSRSVAAYQESVRLSNIRYLSGLSSYFEVLDAQQQLFPAENALAQSKRDQFLAVVNLYRALGGGWMAEEAQTQTQPADTPPSSSK